MKKQTIPLDLLLKIINSPLLSPLAKTVFGQLATSGDRGLNALKLAEMFDTTPERIVDAMVELRSHRLIKDSATIEAKTPRSNALPFKSTARRQGKARTVGQG